MANLFSENFVGYPRLHEIIDFGRSLRPDTPGRLPLIHRFLYTYQESPAVRAVQAALIDYLKSVGVPPSPIDGIYGPQTADLVDKFQFYEGLPRDGIVQASTLKALDNSLPQFSAVVEITDKSTFPGAVLGNIFLNSTNANPPGKIGGFFWPSMPGVPQALGDWNWNTTITPGQSNKPISASLFSVVFDHLLLLFNPSVNVFMRFDAPSSLWPIRWPQQSVPANPWFPHGATGTGVDFRGVDITWRVL